MKLRLIRLADWFDVHILGHRFHSICTLIGNSKWWNIPPEPELTVKYDKQSDTLTVRIAGKRIEVSDNVHGVIVDYDTSRQIVGLEIMDVSKYIKE